MKPRCSLLTVVLLMVPLLCSADDPVNYCHKPEAQERWEQMLAETPRDPIVLRLYALRDGLCHMIDGLVDLEQAIDIFTREHERGVMERHKEDMEKRKERVV